MNRKHILIAFLTVLSFTQVYAAGQEDNRQQRWLNDVREYKQDFLTREVELTQDQQTQFFPLYNAMENEIFQLNKDSRELERKVSAQNDVSDLEYETTAKAMLDVKNKEAQIESSYFDKYSKILSPKQLFLLKRAETRFSRNMLNHHRDRKTK